MDFANDIALVFESMNKLIEALEALKSLVAKKLAWKLIGGKNKVLPVSNFKHTVGFIILLGDHPVEIIGDFTYLWSVVNNMGGIKKKLESHTAKATSIMEYLIKNVFCKPDILTSREAKLKINKTLMVSLIYGTETWPLTVKFLKK